MNAWSQNDLTENVHGNLIYNIPKLPGNRSKEIKNIPIGKKKEPLIYTAVYMIM